MAPDPADEGNVGEETPDRNGVNGNGSAKPVPLAALKSSVNDEKIRYPSPAVVPPSDQDPLLPMRSAMIVIGLGTVIAALALVSAYEPYRFVEGAGEVALSALGTLFIVALFVERAQQVYVGAWRGIERAIVDRRLERWREWRRSAAHYPDENDLHTDIANGLQQAELDLASFRQTTRRYVFCLGLALGVLIAAAGPRILREVLEPWGDPGDLQRWVLSLSDILITGGLIGGGSEGIHKVMVLITDSLDQTRKKVKGET